MVHHQTGIRLKYAVPVVLALFMAAGPAAAQDTAGPDRDTEMIELIQEMDGDMEVRIFGLVRAQAIWPAGVAVGVGGIRVRQPRHYDCRTLCDFSGFTVHLQPATTGIQFGIGYSSFVGEQRSSRRFVRHVYSGWGIKGVAMRLWDSDSSGFSHPTLYGVEGNFTIAQLSISIGVLRPIHREAADDRWQITGGIGWGF
jgi:hypothetical protein